MQSSTKTWIISAAIIAAAILAYYTFFANTPPDQSLLQSQPADAAAAAQVLGLLNQIQSLTIDTKFFDSTSFKSLQDYTVAIPPLGVGRANPFAPLPGIKSAAK